MTDWFRSWHGAPTDPKWRTIARRASVRPGDVFAVVSCLWDRASQAKERGSIAGYDHEVIADALGYEPDEVERIINALVDKAVIIDAELQPGTSSSLSGMMMQRSVPAHGGSAIERKRTQPNAL